MRWQMTGETCQSCKMMGRGAEGGCGTEEKPCPVSRVSPHPPSSTTTSSTCATAEDVGVSGTDGVDFFAQARKALAERSPFDSEEAAARVTTLPVSLAVAYARHADGRRKPKKLVSAEQGKKAKAVAPPPSPVARNLWAETEEYFRDVTLDDVDCLVPKLPSFQDPCLLVPALSRLSEKMYSHGLSGEAEEEKPSIIPTVADAEVLETVGEETELAAADEDDHTGEVVANRVEKEVGAATEEGAVEGDESSSDMMDIDKEDDDHGKDGHVGNVQEKEEGSEHVFSLNRVLGSKHRAILTSEQPNKKRKISGGDAGLERLFDFNHSVHQDLPICDYCCSNITSSITNQMLCCDSCKVSVHQKCYGTSDPPGSAWLCSFCRHFSEIGRPSNEGGPCLLCPKKGGALKQVGDWCKNKEELGFAHLFCSLWAPEVYVGNVELMEPILNIEGIRETRKKLVCNVCKIKHGPCVRCNHGTCRASFHPICARESNHRMEIWGKPGCNSVELRVFCSKHSALQDITSVQHWAALVIGDDDGSLEDNCVTMRSPSNKILESRLTHSNTMVDPNTDMIYATINKNVKLPKQDAPAVKLALNGADDLLYDYMQMIDLLNDNRFSELLTFDTSIYSKSIRIIKKLIEKGKIKMDDVASGIGVSANSLEAAIAGVPDALPLSMGWKLATWLNDSVSMASLIPMGLPKLGSGNSAPRFAEDSAINALSEGPSGQNVAYDSILEKHDASSCVSQPKHGDMNINERKSLFTPKQDHGRSFDDVNEYSHLSHEDEMMHDDMGSAFVAGNCSKQKEDTENVIGYSLERASYFLQNLSEHQGVDRINDSALGMVSAQRSDVGGLIVGTPDDNMIKLSDYHMNLFIKKRLVRINSLVKSEEMKSDAYSAAATASTCWQKSQHFASVPMEDVSRLSQPNGASKIIESNLKDLAKAKTMGILEISPEDEVEGEILQLQNKLLDAAVMIKHHHEHLIFKVASTMSEDLDAMKQKRWDSLLVSRFLREVREAKKRGKKERRHREAQAILAAATAAASSRVLLPKQEMKDVARCGTPEGHVTVEAASGDQSSLHQKAKETPLKLSLSKLSYGKNSDSIVLSCDICKRDETLMNPIFVCGSCKVPVHLDCYLRCKHPISTWYCEPCEALISQSKSVPYCLPQCGLCSTTGGAFRKTTDGQWIHAYCAEWILESSFRRGQEHAVDGMESSLKTKDSACCCICHQKIGVCVKCAYGHCQTTFHPICARNAGLYMITKFINGHMQHKAYCQKHSQEQRDKAEKPGIEELKSIRHIRVELEKLRLLCERIIKREKLKRQLILCSHGILSSRREYTSFSMLVRSRVLHSGISSESATTTENITYSETVERSDDNTVDSTASGKHKVILPSRTSSDKRTCEQSRTHLPSVQKVIGDRTSFSGKQLPWRPTSSASDATNEESKARPRKRAEVFQKEVMMTTDQALKQNQRLPKGFVYVPIDSLPKPKDIKSREPQLPDG